MQQNIIELLIENYGTLTIICTSIFSAIVFLRKSLKNAINSINIINQFTNIFGDNPAKTIKEFIDGIKQSSDIISIRQEIHERHLQVGFYICEPKNGSTLWTNEYLNDLFGLDSQEMKDFGWLRAVPFEERTNIHSIFSLSIKNKTPLQCTYKITNNTSGKQSVVKMDAFPVMNGTEVTCYVGLVIVEKENDKKKTQEEKEEKAPKNINKAKPKEEQKEQ
jgi:hypothetical protein